VRNQLNWLPILILLAIPAAGQSPAANTHSATARAEATPRTPDGKPDLSGDWLGPHVRNMTEGLAGGLPFTPAGELAYKKNLGDVIDPTSYCIYPGVPRITNDGFPIEFVQNSTRLAMLYEYMTVWRTIPIDGTGHPRNVDASFMGNSVGKWDGDTLVIDTVGLKERAWLDSFAHPLSDALHVIERWRRTDRQHMAYEVTIDDPKMYTKTWKHSKVFTLMKSGEGPLEYSCDENNKDRDEGHIGAGAHLDSNNYIENGVR